MNFICGMNLEELRGWLKAKGKKGFHADQIFDWVYRKGVSSWDEMTNLDKALRQELAAEFPLFSLENVKVTDSTDGETVKFLWKLHDGHFVESVLISSFDRRTVCVSSQVGCPARCAFCASGREGLLRQLTPAEIVEQVVHIHRHLATKQERVSHVVFMGMGEPLENYEAVLQTVRLLIDPATLHLSQRRITISTVGVVEGIYKLAEEELKVNLVLSLHAPNQRLRQKIIPYARKYPLEEILQATDHYAKKTKRDLTFEYTLLAGINDQVEHAEELASLISAKQAAVNLIPYNPVLGLRLKRPDKMAIVAFREVLEKRGVVHTCRYTKGDDIAAACGQLAMHHSLDSN